MLQNFSVDISASPHVCFILAGPDPEHSNTGSGGYPPGKKMGNCGAGEAFLSLFYVKMSGFKLNFKSQFDILYAIFCFNLAYTGARPGIQRKKKGNDQDLTKYLINDCCSAGLCVYAC